MLRYINIQNKCIAHVKNKVYFLGIIYPALIYESSHLSGLFIGVTSSAPVFKKQYKIFPFYVSKKDETCTNVIGVTPTHTSKASNHFSLKRRQILNDRLFSRTKRVYLHPDSFLCYIHLAQQKLGTLYVQVIFEKFIFNVFLHSFSTIQM